MHEQVSGNFFTVDLESTRQAFEKLPWVRKVSVRRKFPWSLEVEVEEQVALARWNGKDLVNTHGEVFAGITDQDLPVFTGQPDSSQQVTRMYGELNAALQPMKQQIAQISLSPRYAWQVKLRTAWCWSWDGKKCSSGWQRFVDGLSLQSGSTDSDRPNTWIYATATGLR